MGEMGLGIDGYLRDQKESDYGTPLTGAMSLVAIREGAVVNANVMPIENANIISSRAKQKPDKGRKVNAFSTPMSMYPDEIGKQLNFFLGAADNSAAVGDGAYNHRWLQDLVNQRDGAIFTRNFAQGSELEEQLISCMINKIIIESDNEGNVTLTEEGTAKDYATNKARITSFSYSSLIPFAFKHLTVSEDGLGDISAKIETMTLEIDLNNDTERFKIGDDTVKRVQINGIPILTMNITVDADQQWIDASRAHTSYNFTPVFTSTENAGSTPTVYSLAIELPGCILNPELAHPEQTNERLKQELEFDCSYGGVSTNSGSDEVMFEIRLTDDTATYTA